MRTHTPGGARVSGWAPRAHGSGREAYQTGEGAPIARPKRSRVWRSVALGVGAVDVGEVVRGGVVWFRNDEEKNKIIRIKVLKYLVSTNKSTTFAVFK